MKVKLIKRKPFVRANVKMKLTLKKSVSLLAKAVNLLSSILSLQKGKSFTSQWTQPDKFLRKGKL